MEMFKKCDAEIIKDLKIQVEEYEKKLYEKERELERLRKGKDEINVEHSHNQQKREWLYNDLKKAQDQIKSLEDILNNTRMDLFKCFKCGGIANFESMGVLMFNYVADELSVGNSDKREFIPDLSSKIPNKVCKGCYNEFEHKREISNLKKKIELIENEARLKENSLNRDISILKRSDSYARVRKHHLNGIYSLLLLNKKTIEEKDENSYENAISSIERCLEMIEKEYDVVNGFKELGIDSKKDKPKERGKKKNGK